MLERLSPVSGVVGWIAARPRFKGKGRLLQALLPFTDTALSFYGVHLRVRKGDVTNLYSIGGFYGTLIRDEIQSVSKNDRIFLDIGANAGLYTMIAARHIAPGLVFAFEPNPVIYTDLLTNIVLNGSRNIVPLNMALGETSELMALSYDKKHSGISHLSAGPEDSTNSEFCFQVPVTSLSSLGFLESASRDKRIAVKIDVEGYEVRVLSMLLSSAIGDRIDKIIAEVDDSNLRRFGVSSEDLYELMSSAGFSASFGRRDGDHYDEVFKRAS